MSRKERPQWSEFAPLKRKRRKEVKEDLNSVAYGRNLMFGSQWKVPMFGGFWKVLMLSGLWKVLMFGGPWKVPMFSGLWKVPMFGDFWKEKKKHHVHLFSFSPPTIFLAPSSFSIDIKVLLYHGSRPLLYAFFFFSLNSWHHAWTFFASLKLHKWMKNCLQSRP